MATTAMICPRCGDDNQPEVRFCATCGIPLVSVTDQSVLPSLSLGSLIVETLHIYRKSFWPFIFIAALPQIPFFIATKTPDVVSQAFTLATIAAVVLAYGATVHATAQQTLGRQISVIGSYFQAWRKAIPLIGAAVVFIFVLLISSVLMFIIIGVPLFFYCLVMWFFFVPVVMLECKDSLAALARSRELARGDWLRVLGILCVVLLIVIALEIASALPSFLLTALSALLGSFFKTAVQVLVFPIIAIGTMLLYLDLRVRLEGYSLPQMALEIDR